MTTGRTPKYNAETHPEAARKLALLCYTDKQIAAALDISVRTLYNWKKEYLQFMQALSQGKAIADAEVAAALYRRAVGYSYLSEKILTLNGEVVRVPIEVVVLPDPGACMSWLKNRQAHLWREKQSVELSGEINLTMNLDAQPHEARE
jgi:transposase-like protein